LSKKDRERAAAGEVHRDGQMVKMEPCPVEGCAHFVDPQSDIGLCTECDRIGRVVNYGTTQILLKLGLIRRRGDPPKQRGSQEPKGPVILIPRPGMSRAAIIEAAKSTGVNPEQMEKGGRS